MATMRLFSVNDQPGWIAAAFLTQIALWIAACTQVTDVSSDNQSVGILPVGVYGTHWTPWALDNADLVDFVFYQVNQRRSASEVCAFVNEARRQALDVVLVVNLYDNAAQRAAATGSEPLKSPTAYVSRFSRILDFCPSLDVMAFTLDEENVHWAGRAQFLTELYTELKTAYPKHDFYQWYSPTRTPNVPGKDWPKLPADGWVFDQYFLTGEKYHNYVAAMAATGKPLLSILWASPNWRVDDNIGGYDPNWWAANGRDRLSDALAINASFNIPTAFFMFEPIGPNSSKIMPLWMTGKGCAQRFVEQFFGKRIQTLKETPLPAGHQSSEHRAVQLPDCSS